MRLLDTTTLQLHEFFDESTPPYAILSHRWGEDEVSLQDYEDGRKRDGAGYAKILAFCSFAKSQSHDWVWIDTCCIDKKSSAELSEAINSMLKWYAKSAVCYAYLHDVRSRYSQTAREELFRLSVWFKRGWTLQELLAPSKVVFCDFLWNTIGTKADLAPIIADITGVQTKFLESRRRMYDASVATKMSWASRRSTTRREDMAYCLMGLFDVNMPLLYGEGQKAFIRLQLEIIKKSDDESIFAWTSNDPSWGLLAPSPLAFEDSWNIVGSVQADSPPYSMSNKGLKIRVPHLATNSTLQGFPNLRQDEKELFPLNCCRGASANPLCVCIERKPNGWSRVHCDRLGAVRYPKLGTDPTNVRYVAQPGV